MVAPVETAAIMDTAARRVSALLVRATAPWAVTLSSAEPVATALSAETAGTAAP
jgi:hypothetical protein